MWTQALKIAGIGFAAVLIGLWMLAAAVKIMSLGCTLADRKKGE